MSKAVRTALARTRAPVEARLVLAILAAHANKNLLAWPGADTIALLAGVCERTVRRHIRTLKDLGELRVIRRGMAGKATNVYRLDVLVEDFEVIDPYDTRA